MYKLIKVLFTNIFILLFFTSIVNSKIIYVEKQVTGIGENYKMALRDAIKEAISQVNGLTQETTSIIKTIEKTITDSKGDDNFSSTDFIYSNAFSLLLFKFLKKTSSPSEGHG